MKIASDLGLTKHPEIPELAFGSMADDHGWDKDFAKRDLDLRHTLQRLSERFEEPNRLGHPRCGILMDDLPTFSGYERNFEWINGWYSSRSNHDNTHLLSTLMDQLSGHSAEGAEFWQRLSEYSFKGLL